MGNLIKNRDKLKDYALSLSKEFSIIVEYKFKYVDLEQEIQHLMDVYNSRLLVMIPKTYGFWESIIHKSKTWVMASGMNIPLLSILVE
ncbi:hypothetical protein [Winogradskyella forsetii]|uniref:hypothetical protein n=1 Tax=Winogradskyella forsetii TaxID=2686077 RepID=UPI0015BB3F2A|nr:hypothetical protein [Winogradskyella forsetii]